ncbi:hypothetical protein HNR46_003263 [Haloferula luteola]|uniref:ATPase n=1 Tax=Haloferula luteola TaxID=595692 RepID=A0A840VGQ1_9BACT|nr:permease [Haloferula luteola]MBB5353010.1 hypothetical protein [Haloferula luteola]
MKSHPSPSDPSSSECHSKRDAKSPCCGGHSAEPASCGCGGDHHEETSSAAHSASSCCAGKHEHSGETHPPAAASCCGGSEGEASCCGGGGRVDFLLWGSLIVVAVGVIAHFIGGGPAKWQTFADGTWELMAKSWWGILVGIAAVGVLGQVPKEVVARLLGQGGTTSGILRATFAGTLLDLCNHGILMVGMQLYRKGASLGQVIAFLVSSPWNSLSLTLILIGLIGWKWTLSFIVLSMVIGIISGRVTDLLVKRGTLPQNPHAIDIPEQYRLRDGLAEVWRNIRPGDGNLRRMLKAGLSESRMILRWIFFGFVMAAAIQTFVPDHTFQEFFGPSLLGLLLTLIATTIIEVCSEGSSPIAADLLRRAGAPGNAFTFLMAGAATDYTEIMALRETTRSWKATLALPLLTTPQVLLISWVLNHFSR